jgi:hypothetical protein
MDNSSIAKIQKTLKNSKSIIIKSDDSSQYIKDNYGNKYINDISDSDEEGMSYRKKNSDIINKLSDKNNSNIKSKLDGENLSIRSMSLKKAPLRSTIKEKVKTTDINTENNINDDNNSQNKNSEDESYDSIEEYEFQDDFENQVKNYVKTDDKIKELQKEIKELNQKKKLAEDEIMKHLERLGENNINITGGKLVINKYGSKASLKEDIIKEVLTEKIKDPKIIENIFDKIQEKREENAKIQVNLKRTTSKKK